MSPSLFNRCLSLAAGFNLIHVLYCGSHSHLERDGLIGSDAIRFERSVVREVSAAAKAATITAFVGVTTFEVATANSVTAVDVRLLRLSVRC